MHEILEKISSELASVGATVLESGKGNPKTLVFNQFGMVDVKRDELADRAIHLAEPINDSDLDYIPTLLELKLSQYPAILQHLRTVTVPDIFNGNAQTAIPAYLITLDDLEHLLGLVLSVDVNGERYLTNEGRRLRSKIRSVAASSDAVTPTIDCLQTAAKSIVLVRDAAVRLPTDLQELEESR